MRFSLNKRAQSLIIQAVIGLVLVAIILVVTFAVWNKLFKTITEDSVDDASRVNMELLANAVELLLLSNEDYVSTDFLFHLPGDRIVVGWDSGPFKDFKIEPEMDQCINSEAYKPKQCGEVACLCLYESPDFFSNEAERDKHIILCELFPIAKDESIKFASHYRDVDKDFTWTLKIYLSEEARSTGAKRTDTTPDQPDPVIDALPYSYLSIIGGDKWCKDWTLSVVRDWGLQDVYLDKRVVNIGGKKTHLIYFDKVSDETERRKKFLQRCPDTSLCGCADQYHDAVLTLEEECEGYSVDTQIACVYTKDEQICKPRRIEDCPLGANLLYEDEPCNCGGMKYGRGFCNSEGPKPENNEFKEFEPVYAYTEIDDCARVREKNECSAYHNENNCVLNSCGVSDDKVLKRCVPIYNGDDYVCGDCPKAGDGAWWKFWSGVQCDGNKCECKDYIKKWIWDRDPCGFDTEPVEGCQVED
ncbi:hypothetical protein CMO92_00470 [Candidatus Woesearchaeota archaeon]|nr:hypothetical protein [Candidatus Woesearchaeota archaeon]